MTVSELAAAKNVTLQNASYSQFWDSQLQAGTIPDIVETQIQHPQMMEAVMFLIDQTVLLMAQM